MIKQYLFKKAAKKATSATLKKEMKILAGAVLTIGTHKLIQKAATKYPSLSFLKLKKTIV